MDILEIAKESLHIQTRGIQDLEQIFDSKFVKITHKIAECKGHVIISGVGKSGNIGRKISSTMSSIGIPSFFLDPFNAGHGDLGMITPDDILIFISNSGESDEIMSVINFARTNGNSTISITRDAKSTISTNTDFSIVMPKSVESHEFFAPTTSTTQTLITGDILAVCASKIKNFTKQQYAKLHPSGNLGMKISKVTTIMNSKVSVVKSDEKMLGILRAMSENSNGFTCVVKEEKIYGVVTDGDIRRAILQKNGKIDDLTAGDICNIKPKVLTGDSYIIDAVNLMQEHRISSVIVVDGELRPVGFLHRNQFNI